MPDKGLGFRIAARVSGYLHYFGLALAASSISLILSGLAGLAFFGVQRPEERLIALVFLGFGAGYVLMGFFLAKLQSGGLTKTDAVLVTVFVWIAAPTLNAIPLSMVLGIDYIDALFESVSGWTTTGLSIMTGELKPDGTYYPVPEELPETVKIWRSIIQWVGGVGIVVFTIAFLARPGISAAVLYLAEGRFERLEISLKRSAIRMTQVYIIYTIVGAVMLYLAGMTLEDSILHAMTGIATGGFSTHADSVGFYKGQYLIYIASLAIAFMGSTSFADLDSLLNFRFRKLVQSPELKAMAFAILFVVATTVALWLHDERLRENLELADALYNSLSALSNVGFGTAPLTEAGEAYIIYLIIIMFIGGSAFSTAGGIKLLRFVIIERTLRIEIDMMTKPRGYVPKKRLGGHTLDEKLFRKTLVVFSAFLITYGTILILALTLYSSTYNAVDLAFEVGTALTNMGLSSGVTSPLMPDGLKILLIIAMLLGRLEIIPFVVAVFYVASRLKAVI